MKHSFRFAYKNLLLRPVKKEDLELLRNWRNESHPFLSKIDYITAEKQMEWYRQSLRDMNCCTFAIEETEELNRLIGSMALYNFSGHVCEFGRALLGEKLSRGKGNGFLSTVICLHIGFEKLGMRSISATVDKDNTAALKAYGKAGFEIVKALNENELEICINNERFAEKHTFLAEISEG